MPKKLLIIANWKMNPDSPVRAVRLAKEVEKGFYGVKNVSVVIAPPYPFLESVGRALKRAKLGAQDLFWADTGPYTGAVSWHQLKHLKVKYVILGHSERRIKLGETDAMINKKIKAAIKAGLIPVLAVGEQKRMSNKKMHRVLYRQLSSDLAGIPARAFRKGVIAYEPAWAIGTGLSASPAHARKALHMIQEILGQLWKTPKESRPQRDPTGQAKKVSTPILYGGSVNAKNAAQFVSQKNGGMNGMLVGGASLKPKEFIGIIQSVAKAE